MIPLTPTIGGGGSNVESKFLNELGFNGHFRFIYEDLQHSYLYQCLDITME
jgi:hypothetical protein